MLQGIFHDGITSTSISAFIEQQGDVITIFDSDAGGTPLFSGEVSTIKFQGGVGNIPSKIRLGDNQQFITEDKNGFDSLMINSRPNRISKAMHSMERSNTAVVVSLILIVVMIVLTTTIGVPKLSRHLATNLNSDVLNASSEQTLWLLDKYFDPSTLPIERQQQIADYLKQYSTTELVVEFRSAKFANALALPNGTVVFTDKLIEMSLSDDEILSIFFHEQGHVVKRHGLIHIVQSAMWGILLSFFLTDFGSISDLVINLPLTLSYSANSRELETEADDYAYDLMLEHGIPHYHFANILSRITQPEENVIEDQDKNAEPETKIEVGVRIDDYLSTHPATQQRIERFRN